MEIVDARPNDAADIRSRVVLIAVREGSVIGSVRGAERDGHCMAGVGLSRQLGYAETERRRASDALEFAYMRKSRVDK